VKKDVIRQVFDEVSLGAPENAVGFVMWRIVMRYQRKADRALEICNLINLQFITLAQIAWFGREDRPATQIELARRSGIHPMQVSQTLKVLELKKLVSRR
jgi:DNA-binding MarR family transcriptional regulator